MMNFLRNLFIFILISFVFRAGAQSPLPVSDLRSVAAVIERDFSSIDSIHTIGMSDDPDGRFDVIVVGSGPRNGGWRVEALSIAHHKVTTIWDSAVDALGPQFLNSGPRSVTVVAKDYNYDLFIEGCAPHLCHDGISGFLVFSGKSESTAKAKVVAQGLDKPFTGEPRYDVTFSGSIDDGSKRELETAICESQAIGDKSGLPFSCQKP